MSLFLVLFKLIHTPITLEPTVTVPEAEIEAVFVPAGFEGPVVAAPFEEPEFVQDSENGKTAVLVIW